MHGMSEREIQGGNLHVLDDHERARLRAAAERASKVLPAAVGELVAGEIVDWERFGYRLGGKRRIMQVVDEILKEV